MADKYINPISSKTEDLSSKGETTNQPSNNSSTRADQNYKNNNYNQFCYDNNIPLPLPSNDNKINYQQNQGVPIIYNDNNIINNNNLYDNQYNIQIQQVPPKANCFFHCQKILINVSIILIVVAIVDQIIQNIKAKFNPLFLVDDILLMIIGIISLILFFKGRSSYLKIVGLFTVLVFIGGLMLRIFCHVKYKSNLVHFIIVLIVRNILLIIMIPVTFVQSRQK